MHDTTLFLNQLANGKLSVMKVTQKCLHQELKDKLEESIANADSGRKESFP
jgi:hypothetical protein